MKCEEIVSRVDHLLSERQGSVDQVWDLIERFVLPFRGDFYSSLDEEANVDWHRREVYDSTAVFACQSLAASLQGNLTSPSQKWFGLRFRTDEMNENGAAKEWLEECASRCYEALSEANFDIEVAEGYLDLCGFGTSVLTEELDDRTDKLNFTAIPLREVLFEEGSDKQVYRLYRTLKWTAAQLVEKFGEEGVPTKIREALDDPSQSVERHEVIFAIYPRDTSAELDMSQPIAPKARPFGYKYVLKNTKEVLGEEGGYYEMPAFVSRWRKVAGSRWGHSPAAVALGDILTLNQIKEATLEAAAKVIDPPTLATESALLGDLDLDRGGLNVVTDVEGVRTYESGARFDVSNMNIEMLQQSIQQAFYQDQLELKESPAMTATEVNVRYELMQRLLGPTLGRLKTDFLDPMIQRTFNILYRGGKLPEIPPDLEISEMDIEYTGPLPRAQQADTATAIEQWLMSLAQLAEIYPQALDLPDVDAAMHEIATLRGVPAKVLQDQQEIDKARKQKTQQAEMMQAAQMGQEAGAAMQSVGQGMQAIEGGMAGEEAAAGLA